MLEDVHRQTRAGKLVSSAEMFNKPVGDRLRRLSNVELGRTWVDDDVDDVRSSHPIGDRHAETFAMSVGTIDEKSKNSTSYMRNLKNASRTSRKCWPVDQSPRY